MGEGLKDSQESAGVKHYHDDLLVSLHINGHKQVDRHNKQRDLAYDVQHADYDETRGLVSWSASRRTEEQIVTRTLAEQKLPILCPSIASGSQPAPKAIIAPTKHTVITAAVA